MALPLAAQVPSGGRFVAARQHSVNTLCHTRRVRVARSQRPQSRNCDAVLRICNSLIYRRQNKKLRDFPRILRIAGWLGFWKPMSQSVPRMTGGTGPPLGGPEDRLVAGGAPSKVTGGCGVDSTGRPKRNSRLPVREAGCLADKECLTASATSESSPPCEDRPDRPAASCAGRTFRPAVSPRRTPEPRGCARRRA